MDASEHHEHSRKTHWASKTPAERLQALEFMRQVAYGYDPDTARMVKVLEVVQQDDRSLESELPDCSIGSGEMKYRDLVKRIEADGWLVDRIVGSHVQFRHPTKPDTVTIPAGGKLSRDVPPGTLNSALKQAGLK